MRFLFLVMFVAVLVGLPLYVLNSLVMPQLQSVQQVYAHEDVIANNVAQLHHH
ncbi:MAG: hypothetical protein ACHQT5_01175 [Candidatus Saccharimonadales bacterium]